jgi:hypothetical protein
MIVVFLCVISTVVMPEYAPRADAAAENPSITVVHPNGNEVWELGSQQTIVWTYTGNPGSQVTIELRDGYNEPGYAGGTARVVGKPSIGQNGIGTYTFVVPKDLRPACTYQVRVSVANTNYGDLSDDDFKILLPGERPPITVLSPNGREIWIPGSVQTIRWSYRSDLASKVKDVDIYWFKPAVGTTTQSYVKLGSAPLGQNGLGSYKWQISPTSGPGKSPGSDYKIAIVAHNDRFVRDTSDGCFTVGSASSPTQEPSGQPAEQRLIVPQPSVVSATHAGVALTYNLPRQFSSVQGANNWYYLFGSSAKGPNRAAWDNRVQPWGTVDHYSWNGGSGSSGPRYLEITGRDPKDWRRPGTGGWLQPGEGADISIGWSAPQSGRVYIRGMLNTTWIDAIAGGSNDDGVWFSIWKGTSRLTQEERVFRGNDERNRAPSVVQTVATTVAPGDMIYFYVRRGNWQDCDGMYYSFTITYDPNADLEPPVSNFMVQGDTISLFAEDAGSGVATIEYFVRDWEGRQSEWRTYEGPLVLDNVEKLVFRAMDNVGNLEPYHIVNVGELMSHAYQPGPGYEAAVEAQPQPMPEGEPPSSSESFEEALEGIFSGLFSALLGGQSPTAQPQPQPLPQQQSQPQSQPQPQLQIVPSAGQVLIDDPSFVTLTAFPNASGGAFAASYDLQIKANNPSYPVEVSYLLLSASGTPDRPSSGIDVHPAGEYESVWDPNKQQFYQTEVGGWAQPKYRVNPQVLSLPAGRGAVLMLARYQKIYVIFLNESDGHLVYEVFRGGAFNGLDVPGLGQVTRSGDKLRIHSLGEPVEVGIWGTGQYLHDEVMGFAQQGYVANDKLYDIPKYGMFMLAIARYDKIGLIIGNFNDGQLGALSFTGSRRLETETVPGLCEIRDGGIVAGPDTTGPIPLVHVTATSGRPVDFLHFAFDNTSWRWQVGGWSRPEYVRNPQVLQLRHYTPGFFMVSGQGRVGVFFYNENDMETGVLPLTQVR